MITLLQQLNTIVCDAFEQCGYDSSLGRVTVSDRPDLCQFQCNGAFDGAKQYKKPPFVIAEEVQAVLSADARLQKVEVVRPGFINMILTDAYLLEKVAELAADINLGISQVEQSQTIVIDYGGPNVAKPLHIGHLRSAIIGESVKRIAKATGRKVISDIHLGDWGLQMGLVIAELEERNPTWRCFEADFDPETEVVAPIDVNELNDIYPFASQKSKQDEAFKTKAREVTAALQGGHPGYYAVWKEMMRVSIGDLKQNYARLSVDFDLWYGESDAEKYVPQLLDCLTQKGLLHESDGAMVVEVEQLEDKAPVPPVIIKKSDNSNIYATTDLATIIQRQADFSPDAMWYVVDKRQELHFRQVFRCAQKAQLVPPATQLVHLGFGTMNGNDGKPYKTRDGGVMQLSVFLQTVVDAAYEKLRDMDSATDEQRLDTAQKLATAAIKFGDLSNYRTKDYVFDLDKFLSFEGKTGTYLLYTITRINSILKKCEGGAGDDAFAAIYTDTERELYLSLVLASESFRLAYDDQAPNHICDHAYRLAAQFSTFYHDSHIVSEQDPIKRQTWISLCRLIRKMLVKDLDVLAIEPVESM